jgi:hypothetical protein
MMTGTLYDFHPGLKEQEKIAKIKTKNHCEIRHVRRMHNRRADNAIIFVGKNGRFLKDAHTEEREINVSHVIRSNISLPVA